MLRSMQSSVVVTALRPFYKKLLVLKYAINFEFGIWLYRNDLSPNSCIWYIDRKLTCFDCGVNRMILMLMR